jgi:nitrogen-specific signal transduction histidine kinase
MGTVLASNPEFCSMVGVASHTMLVNKSLEDWLARGGVDLGVLLTNLRQSQTLRSFATDLRSMVGVLIPVDISAVTLNGDDPTYGFFFHELSNDRARDSLPVGRHGRLSGAVVAVGRSHAHERNCGRNQHHD